MTLDPCKMRSAIAMMNERSSNVVSDLSKDWQQWCRLCAKADLQNINIFLKDEDMMPTAETTKLSESGLTVAISKYFNVEMNPDEQLPIQLCTDCFLLITSLINFNERVIKVQQMYLALRHNNIITNLPTLRLKYGVLENEQPHQFMYRSLTEVQLIEKMLKTHKHEEKSCAKEPDAEIKMRELSVTAVDIKKEKQNDVIRLTDEDVCEDFGNMDTEGEDPFGSDVEVSSEDGNKINTKESANQGKENDKVKCETSLPEISLKGKQLISRNKEHKTKRLDSSKSVKKSLKTFKDATADNGEQNEGKTYTCVECSKVFKIFAFYRTHMKRVHAICDIVPQFVCTECPSSFNTLTQLNHHHTIKHLSITERRNVPCPCCEQKFSTKTSMARHIKFVHMNERSFICEECGEAVRTKDQLKQHMLIHTDYAPFECEICEKCFKNPKRLKDHKESHNPNKYVCNECGLQLNSRTTLTRHLLVHSDVMQHKCDYCGRAFKRAKALKNHLILHTGLKPYSCDFCDRTFANGSNCRSHKRKVHPEELAAQEAAGEKTYTKNVPKLALLKSVTQAAENLAPVVCKKSGNFAFGKKYLLPPDGTDSMDALSRKEENRPNEMKS